jgi:LPXTG-motif cell wall-anchored protein
MRHLVLLASVYALVCALILPGSILAQDEPATTGAQTTPAEPPPPQPEQDSAPPAAEPAPPPAAEPAPPPAAEPAPPPAEPQVLADERDEAPAPKTKAIAAASGSVTIADFSFTPGSITVNQGDTVTWVNNGPTGHSATANDGEFNTGVLKAGQSASHTFAKAGTFSYYCLPHPFMKATVVVQAAQTGGSDGDGSGTSGGTGTTGTADTGATASQADSGPALPNTGGDSGALLALGGLILLLGYAVHRRVSAG